MAGIPNTILDEGQYRVTLASMVLLPGDVVAQPHDTVILSGALVKEHRAKIVTAELIDGSAA